MATLFGPETFTGSDGSSVSSITTMPSPGSNTGSSITVQGNRGRFHSGTAPNYAGRVAGRLLSSVGDFEITLTFRFDGSECYPGIYWKTDANCEGRDGYDLRFWPGEKWTIAAFDEWSLVGGAPLATVTLPFAANTDYKVRLRVIGTNIKARVWLATDSEPSTWGADVTNSYYTAAGPLYLASSGGVSANGIMYYDDVQVTDGSTATVQVGAATLSTTSAMTATGLLTDWGEVVLGTVSSLTAYGAGPPKEGAATLSTASAMAATGQDVKVGSATLSSASSLTATAAPSVKTATATLGTKSELFAFVSPDGESYSSRPGNYSSGIYGEGAYGGIAFDLDLEGSFRSGDYLTFTPPVQLFKFDVPHPLFRRMSAPEQVSILVFGTTVREIDEPSNEEMEAADAVFLGGRSYVIDGYTASLLALAGYGQYLHFPPLYPSSSVYPGGTLYPRS